MVQAGWPGGRLKKLAIAFYGWAKGYFDPKWRAQFQDMSEHDMETVETVMERIQRRSIPSYATDDFWEAINMWRDYRDFGFPEAGGLNDQPALWLDVVRLMMSCAKKMKVE